jgi:hypothetical protein
MYSTQNFASPSTYGFDVQSIIMNRSGSRNLETLTLQLFHIRNPSDTVERQPAVWL